MVFGLQVHSAVEDIDGLDDVENSILYYNQAVIHYHMRQYSEAIAIGEKLYQFLEPFGMIFTITEKLIGALDRVSNKNIIKTHTHTPAYCCFSAPDMGKNSRACNFKSSLISSFFFPINGVNVNLKVWN